MYQMIALITGATSGIGKACAEILSKNGYKTILIGRRNEKLQSLSKKLNEPSLPLQLDVRVKDKVFNAFFTTKDKGTGLGLTICQNLATRLNSQLILEESSPKGTKFSMIVSSESSNR